MREPKRMKMSRRSTSWTILIAILGISCYINTVSSSPAWPSFTKRNVQALARDGLLSPRSNAAYSYKRSISTLAKNGQLPTLSYPGDSTEEEDDTDESQKRNIASIARLSSYPLKRNTGTLARNGVRAGKRNIGSLARNGYLKNDADVQKRENTLEDEYYYPFYQNSIPPVEDMDYPLDYNELYDLQQSMHPGDLPPLSDIYKGNVAALLRQNAFKMIANNPNYRPNANENYEELGQVIKRQSFGLPNHGLYRTLTPDSQSKRYIISFPESSAEAQILAYEDLNDKTEKRSVGSIPLTRISELGNISLIPKVSLKPIQTTPTYRRRQYLLTRTQPAEGEVDQ